MIDRSGGPSVRANGHLPNHVGGVQSTDESLLMTSVVAGQHAGGQRLPSEDLPPPPSPATLMMASTNHQQQQVPAHGHLISGGSKGVGGGGREGG